MRELLAWFFHHGVTTYLTQILTQIPAQASNELTIAKTMQQQIGRIFGLSVYTDGFWVDNSPLITTGESRALYLNLKDSATNFFQNKRLSELNFDFSGVPTPSGERFHPVNLLSNFDLSTSNYINPTAIVSAPAPAQQKMIVLNVYYISEVTYNRLLRKNVMWLNGLNMQEAIEQQKK